MTKIKKIALVLLFLFLTLTTSQPVTDRGANAVYNPVEVFPDVPETHWARERIKVLSAKQYIKGYNDGTFLPDRPMTRAELAAVLVRMAGDKPPVPEKPSFSDVGREDWFYSTVEEAKLFFPAGSSSNQEEFRPHDPVTRQEAVVATVRAKKLKTGGADLPLLEAAFTDLNNIIPEYRDDIVRALKFRLVSGYPDKTFRPESPLTRAEAASLIYGAFFPEIKISDLMKAGAFSFFEKTPEEFDGLSQSLNSRFGSWEGVKIDIFIKETAIADNQQDKSLLVLARVDRFKYFTFSDVIFKPDPVKIRRYAEKISAAVSQQFPERRNIVLVCFFDLIYYDTVAEVYGPEYTRYSPPDRGWRIERFYAGAMSLEGKIADTWLETGTT